MSIPQARVNKELEDLHSKNYVVDRKADQVWHVTFDGPETSPFQGFKFTVELILEGFPFNPPKIFFKTSIYHPNVDDKGKVCQDMVAEKSKWDPKNRITLVMEKLKSVMLVPSPSNNSNLVAFNDLQNGTWHQKAKTFSQKNAK